MKSSSKKAFALFLTFLKIGAFTFGGGYAMIPLIERELCEKKKWLEKKDILEIIAIAESTPGPIAVNAATFVGYRTAGFLGAFLSTFGVVLPSFVIITLLSFVIREVKDLTAVRYAFFGVKAGVVALILRALYQMYVQSPKGVFSYLVMAFAFLCVGILKINAVWVIVACALFGLVYTFLIRKEAGDDTP